MGILGTIVLIFLAVHLQNFWFQMKFGYTPYAKYELVEPGVYSKTELASDISDSIKKEDGVYKDLDRMVKEAFKNVILVALYVIGMLGLAFHLAHGFQSAFQTIGINHNKYTPFIKAIGIGIAIIIPALFCTMPIYFFMVN